MSAVRLATVVCLCAAVLVTVVVDHAADACLGGPPSTSPPPTRCRCCDGGCSDDSHDRDNWNSNPFQAPDLRRDPFIINPNDLLRNRDRVIRV